MFLSREDGRVASVGPVHEPVAKAAPQVAMVLRQLLADVYALQTAVQGAHWNVNGMDFAQYHELFSEIYEDVSGSVDPLAENILKIGGLAPASLSAMQAERTTTDPVEGRDPRALASAIADMNDAVIGRILAAFEVATAANEQGVADFLAGRDDMHKKWRWQLRASLGQPVG